MILVKTRSAFHFSEPIPLAGEGLSVVLPVGPGWKILTEWNYEQDNSFTLVGALTPRTAPLIEIRWQYKLAEPPMGPREVLEKIVEPFHGPVSPIETLEGPLVFCQVQLFSRADGEQILLAAAVPREGRVLLLQLKSFSDSLLLSELFEQLASRVVYQPDPRRQIGRRLSEEITSRLYPQWLDNLSRRADFFLLSSPSGTPLGYSKTAAVQPADPFQTALEQEQFFRQNNFRLQTRFETAGNIDEFVWTTYRQIRRRPLQIRVRRLRDGAVQIQDSYQRERVCWPSKEALPEILLPLAARAMLDTEQPEAVLDLIAFSGQVVPILLTRSAGSAASSMPESTAAVVKIVFLHHAENYEEYYFNAQHTLLARLEVLPDQPGRLWKPAEENDLRRLLNPSAGKPEEIVYKEPLKMDELL